MRTVCGTWAYCGESMSVVSKRSCLGLDHYARLLACHCLSRLPTRFPALPFSLHFICIIVRAFGSFACAAPEVISRKPYTMAVDNWTLGVLMFIL